LEISAALGVALIVAMWRYVRRQRRSTWTGPIPDVGSPPADARPIGRARYEDNGFATYWLELRPPRLDGAGSTARGEER
jgi:hypothetical protein